MVNKKVYLGDAVYARYDGHGIELTTDNGLEVTNSIYLENEVLHNLEFFKNKIFDWLNQGKPQT
jgi:hypothetical protein